MRSNIQIVAAACSLLLLLDLHGVQIGDLALDHLDGLVLVDAADVHGDEKVSLHIHEVREDTVLDLRGQYLQEGHRAVHFAHAKAPRLPELEGRRRDKILYGQAGGRQPVPFKGEGFPFGMEEAVQQHQPLRQQLQRQQHRQVAQEALRSRQEQQEKYSRSKLL